MVNLRNFCQCLNCLAESSKTVRYDIGRKIVFLAMSYNRQDSMVHKRFPAEHADLEHAAVAKLSIISYSSFSIHLPGEIALETVTAAQVA